MNKFSSENLKVVLVEALVMLHQSCLAVAVVVVTTSLHCMMFSAAWRPVLSYSHLSTWTCIFKLYWCHINVSDFLKKLTYSFFILNSMLS